MKNDQLKVIRNRTNIEYVSKTRIYENLQAYQRQNGFCLNFELLRNQQNAIFGEIAKLIYFAVSN